MPFRDVMTSPAVTVAPDLSLRRMAQPLDRPVTGVPGVTRQVPLTGTRREETP